MATIRGRARAIARTQHRIVLHHCRACPDRRFCALEVICQPDDDTGCGLKASGLNLRDVGLRAVGLKAVGLKAAGLKAVWPEGRQA